MLHLHPTCWEAYCKLVKVTEEQLLERTRACACVGNGNETQVGCGHERERSSRDPFFVLRKCSSVACSLLRYETSTGLRCRLPTPTRVNLNAFWTEGVWLALLLILSWATFITSAPAGPFEDEPLPSVTDAVVMKPLKFEQLSAEELFKAMLMQDHKQRISGGSSAWSDLFSPPIHRVTFKARRSRVLLRSGLRGTQSAIRSCAFTHFYLGLNKKLRSTESAIALLELARGR